MDNKKEYVGKMRVICDRFVFFLFFHRFVLFDFPDLVGTAIVTYIRGTYVAIFLVANTLDAFRNIVPCCRFLCSISKTTISCFIERNEEVWRNNK